MRSAVLASAVLLLAVQSAAQTVRVLDRGGAPVAGIRVVFSCEDGPERLRRLHRHLREAALPAPPLEEQPDGGVVLPVLTDALGEATALPGEYEWWVARVVRGDEGVEAEFSKEDSRGVVELRLQPLRRVRALLCDGRPAAGILLRHENTDRTVRTDAEGRAVLASVVGFRRVVPGAGVEWAAPGPRVVERWAEGGAETVLRLPPLASLVVVDASHAAEGPWAKLSIGSDTWQMRQARMVFDQVPARATIDLYVTAQFYEGWERLVVLEEGETRIVTFRGPATLVTIEGTIATRPRVADRLSVFAFFMDREPGEPANEALVEDDGSFTLRLSSLRPAAGRDVVIYAKPERERVPRRSPFPPIRKRLGAPDRDGSFQVGLLEHEAVPPWFEGVVTDLRGRPLPRLELEVNWLGCRGAGGYACSSGDYVPVPDPGRPVLDEWPRKVRTDDAGRFSVTGNQLDRLFEFTLADGRRVWPTSVEPSLSVHVIVDDGTAVPIEVDAATAKIDDRETVLDFEARLEPSSSLARPVLRTETAYVGPPAEGEEPKPWAATMHLGPGRWSLSMRVGGSTDVVAAALVDVDPAPRATAEAAPRRIVLSVVRPLLALRRASVRVVDANGQPCPGADVRTLRNVEDGWDWEGDDPVVEFTFTGETIEVAATAEGFLPTCARIGPGPATLTLARAPAAAIRVRLQALPPGVQENVEWSAWASFVRPLAGASCPSPPEWSTSQRLSSGSTALLQVRQPGIYRLTLRSGGLLYAVREVEVGSDGPVNLELSVDPDSEGMRALRTGVAR